MTKGLRKMRESLSVIDLVLEIRDARLPLTTINPEFEKLFGSDKGFLPKNGKKRLVVYNKRDLAEPGLEIVCPLHALMLKQAKCPPKKKCSPYSVHCCNMLASFASLQTARQIAI